MLKRLFLLTLFLGSIVCAVKAQDSLSITLENVKYPYPVHFLPLKIEGQDLRMAYMDVAPVTAANGRTVMLFHGKNFGGYYWTNVIQILTAKGYRVIVPDQIGFGRSSKAFIHYSFHQLVQNNRKLLDTLGIGKVTLLGHSMGGMLATRFTLMYPDKVEKLLLEDPIGLEDYHNFVPYVTTEQEYQTELRVTYESIKKYYQAYFASWKPEYEYLVKIGTNVGTSADFPRYAKVAALTYTMIYEQPVCYEFNQIKVPTVLFIGKQDKTIVGKALLKPEEQAKHGQYTILGPQTAQKIPGCKLIEFDNCGHIPHWEVPGQFLKALVENL